MASLVLFKSHSLNYCLGRIGEEEKLMSFTLTETMDGTIIAVQGQLIREACQESLLMAEESHGDHP